MKNQQNPAGKLRLVGADVLFAGDVIRPAELEISFQEGDGVFSAVQAPTSQPVGLDLSGYLLAPGLIDLQLNGAFGLDFTTDPHTIWETARRLPNLGLTSFLPTVITSPLEVVEAAQQHLLAEAPANAHLPHTAPLGLHLEGPFLNPIRKGAHRAQCLRLPSREAVQSWTAQNGVCLVTLAPELPGALDLIQQLCDQGVLVSLGHSDATYEQAQAGFQAGARMATHLFNAMRPILHRDPGIMTAMLELPIAVGIIPDGVHVHPALVRLAGRMKERGQLIGVTDAMSALGSSPGEYLLGESRVFVTETTARLADGTLAGSVVTPLAVVQNLASYCGFSLAEAWACMSSAPAKLLNLSNRGAIAEGYLADLLVLRQSAAGIQLVATITRGQLAYCTVPAIQHYWEQNYVAY